MQFRYVKDCIAWAAGQGYYKAKQAAKDVEGITGDEMFPDPSNYNKFSWRRKGEEKAEE